MQPLTWYVNRIQSMSTNEIRWRIESKLRDLLEWYRFKKGYFPSYDQCGADYTTDDFEPAFHICEADLSHWRSFTNFSDGSIWLQRLIEKAGHLRSHEFSFFNLENVNLGDPIDWNRDHGAGREAPVRFAQSIDYRDFEATGDCKLVWEPNRHHQLVVLGRAYRATGSVDYAMEVVQQIESWLDQCPYGMGMNWRSPMELSIRMINWVWALDLIRDSGVITDRLKVRLMNAIHLHVKDVSAKYSRGSSANNHLIGETAGVFIAASYFNRLENAAALQRESKRILIQEVVNQSHPDGGGREQALGYQLFVLQFFIVSGVVAEKAGDPFPMRYWKRVEKMLAFVGHMTAGGSHLPLMGDSDDGYVLDLGSTCYDFRSLLCMGAVHFNRPDFKVWAGQYREPCFWLLGPESLRRFNGIDKSAIPEILESKAFPSTGLYLLQDGKRNDADRISIVIDCGELGFGAIAAHGHADALSFCLRVGGEDIFVDPGTYDYFTYPEWRSYFRSTKAHNTLVVDGLDQSEMNGPFMWGQRAHCRCLEWQPTGRGGRMVGEHSGYMRLEDPVLHRRHFELQGEEKTLWITDEILAKASHEVGLYLHLAETCRVEMIDGHEVTIASPVGVVFLKMDRSLSVSTVRGKKGPIGGWYSPGYHRKMPVDTIVGTGRIFGDTSLRTEIRVNSKT